MMVAVDRQLQEWIGICRSGGSRVAGDLAELFTVCIRSLICLYAFTVHCAPCNFHFHRIVFTVCLAIFVFTVCILFA